jgi:hypothetical protein
MHGLWQAGVLWLWGIFAFRAGRRVVLHGAQTIVSPQWGEYLPDDDTYQMTGKCEIRRLLERCGEFVQPTPNGVPVAIDQRESDSLTLR